jgi:N-acetylneuraminate synthase/N,N'-diacetyllegionaminate synthase
MRTVDIGGFQVGGSACCVIAEAGVNHNGDVALAHRLVDAAADAGADAVKFQTFDPELLAAPRANRAEYQTRALRESGSQLDMLRELVLPTTAYAELMAHACERGLLFLSTPFDEGNADLLDRLGVPAFKVSSGDLTNALLLRHLARKGKPLLLSTGMADLDEVIAAVGVIHEIGRVPLVVLHCVSNYPADTDDCNLRAIPEMRSVLDLPIGFSDHTRGYWAAAGAVALGAVMIEKHLTLDRSLAGPDQHASADPDEFRVMVQGIREVSRALGSGRKIPADREHPIASTGRRSLHWRRAMHQGEIVREEDLIALRPSAGLSPLLWRTVIGRKLARDTRANEPIGSGDLEP